MSDELFPSSRAKRDHRRGATGLSPSSWRSEDILERPNAILNPAIGPGSTTFSSVASTFDFQPHLGSDPAAELLVVKGILLRECLLSRLEAVCCDVRKRGPRCAAMPNEGPDKPLGENAEEIIQLLSRTRETTVAVIEAITVWRGEINQHPPPPFLWHGENYLLKITNDLNFLAGVEPLSATLKIHPARLCRNPLMLPKTLDEQLRDGNPVETSDGFPSPRVGKRRQLCNAAQILLDEECLQRKRELVRQESQRIKSERHYNRGETSPTLGGYHDLFQSNEETASAKGGIGVKSSSANGSVKLPSRIKGASSSSSVAKPMFPIRSIEDKAGVQRIHQLSSWHKKARSQLVSLSRSPADDQYLLHSSRFWNKGDLDYGNSGHQSPPSRRRSTGPARSKRLALGRSTSERGGRTLHDVVIPRGKGFQEVRIAQPDRIPQGVDYRGRESVGSQGLSTRHHEVCSRDRREGAVRTREDDGGCKVQTNAVGWNQPGGDGANQEGEVKPLSLASLTAQDIQSLLEEETPIPAAAIVCAAVAFLLAPDDKLPEDFHWPQGFEAVALPVEDFLDKLHEASKGAVSSFKARVLKFVMQRRDMLPVVIEQQEQHAVACLCAWVLENLQSCEEFRVWSHFALKTWYETQQSTNRARASEIPKDSTVIEPRTTLFYKSLHRLSDVGSSFVISLFEDSDRSGGMFVRAFDRASFETFWLPLSAKQVASFGSNATRSPTRLASALARTLKMKRVGANGVRRLVMPPIERVESRKRGVVRNLAKGVRVKVSGGNTVVVGLPGMISSPLKPQTTKSTRVSDTLQQMRPSRKARRSLHFSSRRSNIDGDSPKAASHGKIAEDSSQSVEKKPETPITSVSVDKENMASLPYVGVQTKEAPDRTQKEQGERPSLCKAKRDPPTTNVVDEQGKVTSAHRPENQVISTSSKPVSEQGGVKWDNERQAPGGVRAKKMSVSDTKDFVECDNGRALRRRGRAGDNAPADNNNKAVEGQGGMNDKAVADALGKSHDRPLDPLVGENINSLLWDGEAYEDDFEDGDGGMKEENCNFPNDIADPTAMTSSPKGP